MATWKKLVVSGSAISQLNNDVGYITAAAFPNSYATASFDGTDILANASTGSLNFASGSDGLRIVADASTRTLTFDLDAVPNSSLANSSINISGSGISLNSSVSLGGSGSVDVNVDDSTIEISSDSLQVKDGGITFDKLAAAAVVTEAEGITNNDNDTTIATNAAIIDFVNSASQAAGALDISGSSGDDSIDLDTEDLLLTGSGVISAAVTSNTVTFDVIDGTIENAHIADTTIANTKLVNDSITIGNHEVNLGESVTLAETGFNSGSFSGSFQGDGSNLTGIASSLAISQSAHNGISATDDLLNLKTGALTVTGRANEVTVDLTDDTLTFGLPDDVIIAGDLTVQGTASFNNEQTLLVEDRFILLASGSTGAGDGGIVVQQATQDVGEVFGFEDGAGRWGVDKAFDSSNTSFTPDGYMAIAINTAGNDPNSANDPGSDYNKKGNIYVASNSEDIWIYS